MTRKIELDRSGRDWSISYQKDDGFTLHVYESSFWGDFLGRAFLALTDHDEGIKLGPWRTPRFCWISPWEWTYKVGVWEARLTWVTLDGEGEEVTHGQRLETANLGSAWWKLGQWLVTKIDDLERQREVFKLSLTPEQVQEHFPDAWGKMSFLLEDDDDEEESEE